MLTCFGVLYSVSVFAFKHYNAIEYSVLKVWTFCRKWVGDKFLDWIQPAVPAAALVLTSGEFILLPYSYIITTWILHVLISSIITVLNHLQESPIPTTAVALRESGRPYLENKKAIGNPMVAKLLSHQTYCILDSIGNWKTEKRKCAMIFICFLFYVVFEKLHNLILCEWSLSVFPQYKSTSSSRPGSNLP